MKVFKKEIKSELTDEEIRKYAEEAGFWGVDLWWRGVIPKFRLFIKLIAAKQNKERKGEIKNE